jgi:glutamate--cysteine ligase
VTDVAHPSVKEIALKVMAAIPGLEFAGIDFMTTDIAAPQSAGTYIIVEVNGSPGFCIHDYPYEGQNRHAAREFLFLIFPELRDMPVPAK